MEALRQDRHIVERASRACEEKLAPGIALFTEQDATDPTRRNQPLRTCRPAFARYWTRLVGRSGGRRHQKA